MDFYEVRCMSLAYSFEKGGNELEEKFINYKKKKKKLTRKGRLRA